MQEEGQGPKEEKQPLPDLAEATMHREFQLTEGKVNLAKALEQVPDEANVCLPFLTPRELDYLLKELEFQAGDFGIVRGRTRDGRDWIQALHDKILANWEYA